MSDNPANPFQTITQVDAQYTDCGPTRSRRTIVRQPSEQSAPGRVRGVVSAAAGTDMWSDRHAGGAGAVQERHQPVRGCERPRGRGSAPSRDPGPQRAAEQPGEHDEIAEPEISYPDDPDGVMDWTERGLTGLEPAAVACHDIVIHVPDNIAGGLRRAGQIWRSIRHRHPDTEEPMAIGDDKLSSGGKGQFQAPSTSSTR